ncbi:hypothetical protein GPECTOR_43g947 [Gonium pectorale]|uniref:Laminin EGF-like domain-containing protein n=1 Tax=Gonium pectorale TaxID=33097 RepID=A0A150GAX3_GONPE|nr:hypothetical protein GPECTOR_43g947 [Gonium pectorale]|eukprot:KXZ46510.1 hypothetical protein GPECTOR_43g947 [Gonium pectorale]
MAAGRDVNTAAHLYGNRTAGWYAIGLLPHALNLLPDSFATTYNAEGRPRECSESAALAASVRAFGLPRAAKDFTFVALFDPPQRDYNATARGALGELFSVGGLSVQWDVVSGVVRIFAAWETGSTVIASAASAVPSAAASWPAIALSVSRRSDGALGVCINGAPAPIVQRPLSSVPQAGGWLGNAALSLGWSLAAADQVNLGDPRATISAKTRLHQLWFVNQAWSCTDVERWMSYDTGTSAAPLAPLAPPPRLAALPYANTAPTLESLEVAAENGGTGAEGEAFVGQRVTVTARLEDADGDPLRVRLVAYGVPARGCATAGCGDDVAEANGTGSVTLTYQTAFALPGRFVLRLEASDQTGLIRGWDVAVLVRKQGDLQRLAPCCRSTGMVVAGQSGRPIHSTRFRDPRVASLAASLGWPASYLANEDLEAERLFDWGVLAPAHDPAGLQLSPCMDAFLAGPGSPRVLAGSVDQRTVANGHGKRLLIVPQGYDWAIPLANKSNAPACNSHWTQWAADSPYRSTAGTFSDGTPIYCSYACTRNGTRALQQLSGMTDRLMEAMAELSYGRFSFSWDVTLASSDPFAYNDAPVGPFLQRSGVERAAFHTAAVLSPLPPRSINPGYTAWSAVGAATLFVMRCMPELYYLVHEVGHLLGLPHADVWRVDDGMAAPSDPAGPGMAVDAYSDKLDMMACCRGDYGALARIWLGWMPYPERRDISLSETSGAAAQAPDPTASQSASGAAPPPQQPPPDPADADAECVPSAGPDGCSYTLWPMDRAESRGRLKALSVRLTDTQLAVLSYKSLPWWQDARVGRDPWDAWAPDRDSLVADETRAPLAGLSAEYMRLVTPPGSAGSGQWSTRGLLDFNLFFGEWPSSLPRGPSSLPLGPAKSAFALLKAGQAWLHAGSGVLVVVQGEVPCDGQAELPVYNYTVPNFYGFRGETPGGEAWRRSDYSGYAGGLRCLRVAVRTQLARAHTPGKLAVRLRLADSDAASPLDLRGSCGFPLLPLLQLVLPAGAKAAGAKATAGVTGADASTAKGDGSDGGGGDALPPGIAAAVWTDPRNATFAVGTMTARLPPFSDGWVREASSTDSAACAYGCDPTYRIRIASYDGAQTLVSARLLDVSTTRIALHVSYRYYTLDEITTESEVLYVPVVPPWAEGTQSLPPARSASSANPRVVANPTWGLQLLGDAGGPRRQDEQPAALWSAQVLPPSGCSQQWSFTMLLRVATPSARDGRWPLAELQLSGAADGNGSGGATGTRLALSLVWNTTLGATAPGVPSYATRGSIGAAGDGASSGGAPGLPVFALSLSLGSGREASILMAPPPPSGDQSYHVAVVYDNGQLGAWVDGGGGWPWRDVSCEPARPGVTYCAPPGPGGSPVSSASSRSASAPLQRISLLGGAGGLDATLLSARLYNYAMPRADLSDEASCLLQPGTCAARFGLRTAAPPPQAAADADTAASAVDGPGGSGPAGTVAMPLPEAQAGEWDGLRKAGELSLPPNAPPPPPNTGAPVAPRYSLQIGSWSACSAACGGGVAVRAVLCFRATVRGPWPVAPDDCPLVGYQPSTAPCNQQPCPQRRAALAPAPGPGACPVAGGDGGGDTGGGGDAAAGLQPLCLQDDGLVAPLAACANTSATSHTVEAAAAAKAATKPGAGSSAVLALGATFAGPLASASWESIALPGLVLPPPSTSSRSGNGIQTNKGTSAAAAAAATSLRQVLLAGELQPSCAAVASAVPANAAVEWRLGPWGPCNVSCAAPPSGGAGSSGDGVGYPAVRRRQATCHSVTTGAQLGASVCEAVLGPLAQAALAAPCGGGAARVCGVPAWRVGGWSVCNAVGSTMGYGRATRSLFCVNAVTGRAADSADQCSQAPGTTAAAPPPAEAGCALAARLAAWCVPPALTRAERPCFGNGACTYAGCICNVGFAGQFCEVPLSSGAAASGAAASACPSGILDRAGACCASGLLATDGNCCGADVGGTAPTVPASSAATHSTRWALDGEGRCCSQQLDACGVCGGSAVALDVQGFCCRTLLDQYGRCCRSGRLDECGVCDGDGTSCAVRMQLLLTLAPAAAFAAPEPWWSHLPPSPPAPSPPTAPGTPRVPPASLTAMAGAAATGGAPTSSVISSNTQRGTIADGSPLSTPGLVGWLADGADGHVAAAVQVTIDAPAEQLLGGLVRAALGPSHAALQLRLVDSVAASPTARAGGNSSSAPAPPWLLVTYDLLYNEDAQPAQHGTDNTSYDMAPLEPYSFTTGVAGLRLEGLSDAVGVLGPVLASSASAAASASFTLSVPPSAAPVPATPPPALSPTGPQTVETGDNSGAPFSSPLPPSPAPISEPLWRQQSGPEQRPHYEVQPQPGPPRRRHALAAADAPLTHGSLGQLLWAHALLQASSDADDGALQLLGRAGLEGPDAVQPAGRHSDRLDTAVASKARRLRRLHHIHHLTAGAISAGRRAAAAVAGAASPSASASASPSALVAGLAAAMGADAPQDRRAAAEAVILSPEARAMAAALGLQTLSVAGLERLGSCGNGICEVGEQGSAVGGRVVAAAAACPQDCPLTLRSCPAGSWSGGAVGNGGGFGAADVRTCCGRGACLLSSGACACFEGYTGDACEACAPGFQRTTYGGAAGSCVRQYVRGRTVLEWDALGPASQHGAGPLDNTVVLACLIAGSVLVTLAGVASLGAWLRRAKGLPLLPWAKAPWSATVVPTPTQSPAQSPARPSPKRRIRRSPKVTPVGAARAGAAASPGSQGWVSPTVGPTAAAAAGGAVTPVRRAMLRVIANGEDWQANGLQVIPAPPSLHTSPPDGSAQRHGSRPHRVSPHHNPSVVAPSAASPAVAPVAAGSFTTPGSAARPTPVRLWDSAVRAAAVAFAEAAAAVTPTRRHHHTPRHALGPSLLGQDIWQSDAPEPAVARAHHYQHHHQSPAQPQQLDARLPVSPPHHQQQQVFTTPGHPSTPRRRRATPLGEAREARSPTAVQALSIELHLDSGSGGAKQSGPRGSATPQHSGASGSGGSYTPRALAGRFNWLLPLPLLWRTAGAAPSSEPSAQSTGPRHGSASSGGSAVVLAADHARRLSLEAAGPFSGGLRLLPGRNSPAADVEEDSAATPLLSSARNWPPEDGGGDGSGSSGPFGREEAPTMMDAYLAAAAAVAPAGGRRRSSAAGGGGCGSGGEVASGGAPAAIARAHLAATPLSPTASGGGLTQMLSPRVAALRGQEAGYFHGSGSGPAAGAGSSSVVKSPRRALLQARTHGSKQG